MAQPRNKSRWNHSLLCWSLGSVVVTAVAAYLAFSWLAPEYLQLTSAPQRISATATILGGAAAAVFFVARYRQQLKEERDEASSYRQQIVDNFLQATEFLAGRDPLQQIAGANRLEAVAAEIYRIDPTDPLRQEVVRLLCARLASEQIDLPPKISEHQSPSTPPSSDDNCDDALFLPHADIGTSRAAHNAIMGILNRHYQTGATGELAWHDLTIDLSGAYVSHELTFKNCKFAAIFKASRTTFAQSLKFEACNFMNGIDLTHSELQGIGGEGDDNSLTLINLRTGGPILLIDTHLAGARISGIKGRSKLTLTGSRNENTLLFSGTNTIESIDLSNSSTDSLLIDVETSDLPPSIDAKKIAISSGGQSEEDIRDMLSKLGDIKEFSIANDGQLDEDPDREGGLDFHPSLLPDNKSMGVTFVGPDDALKEINERLSVAGITNGIQYTQLRKLRDQIVLKCTDDYRIRVSRDSIETLTEGITPLTLDENSFLVKIGVNHSPDTPQLPFFFANHPLPDHTLARAVALIGNTRTTSEIVGPLKRESITRRLNETLTDDGHYLPEPPDGGRLVACGYWPCASSYADELIEHKHPLIASYAGFNLWAGRIVGGLRDLNSGRWLFLVEPFLPDTPEYSRLVGTYRHPTPGPVAQPLRLESKTPTENTI